MVYVRVMSMVKLYFRFFWILVFDDKVFGYDSLTGFRRVFTIPCMASMARGSMRTCTVSGWVTPYPVRAKPGFRIQNRDVQLMLPMNF
jgi:hypothetical protein